MTFTVIKFVTAISEPYVGTTQEINQGGWPTHVDCKMSHSKSITIAADF